MKTFRVLKGGSYTYAYKDFCGKHSAYGEFQSKDRFDLGEFVGLSLLGVLEEPQSVVALITQVCPAAEDGPFVYRWESHGQFLPLVRRSTSGQLCHIFARRKL